MSLKERLGSSAIKHIGGDLTKIYPRKKYRFMYNDLTIEEAHGFPVTHYEQTQRCKEYFESFKEIIEKQLPMELADQGLDFAMPNSDGQVQMAGNGMRLYVKVKYIEEI